MADLHPLIVSMMWDSLFRSPKRRRVRPLRMGDPDAFVLSQCSDRAPEEHKSDSDEGI